MKMVSQISLGTYFLILLPPGSGVQICTPALSILLFILLLCLKIQLLHVFSYLVFPVDSFPYGFLLMFQVTNAFSYLLKDIESHAYFKFFVTPVILHQILFLLLSV